MNLIPHLLKGMIRYPVQADKLYCVAIVHRRSLRTIRDLRARDAILLKNVLKQGRKALEERYGVPPDKLRVFLHYLPSYFHLHVHFMHMGMEPTFGMAVNKAHAIQEVISNLEICDEFYVKATLACSVGELDPLLQQMKSFENRSKLEDV
jgi:m7GpppX diphosphatase